MFSNGIIITDKEASIYLCHLYLETFSGKSSIWEKAKAVLFEKNQTSEIGQHNHRTDKSHTAASHLIYIL